MQSKERIYMRRLRGVFWAKEQIINYEDDTNHGPEIKTIRNCKKYK